MWAATRSWRSISCALSRVAPVGILMGDSTMTVLLYRVMMGPSAAYTRVPPLLPPGVSSERSRTVAAWCAIAS